MENNDLQYILNRIELEEVEYTIIDYSNFEEIKNEKFHKLRENYRKAHYELLKYLQDVKRENMKTKIFYDTESTEK